MKITETRKCYCCGRENHVTSACRYREYECNFCRKKGHLEKVCKSKLNVNRSKEHNKSKVFTDTKKYHQGNFHKSNKFNKFLGEGESNEDSSQEVYDISNLFQVQEITPMSGQIHSLRKKVDPIKVSVNVEGQEVVFEADTGSCVSVLSEKDYQNKLGNVQMQPTELILSSYTHERIKPLGKFMSMLYIIMCQKGLNCML